jgi:hypothetical protein
MMLAWNRHARGPLGDVHRRLPGLAPRRPRRRLGKRLECRADIHLSNQAR